MPWLRAAGGLGSVGLTVAARAECPVVVVRGSEQSQRGTFGRGVVGVGAPTEGSGAVRFAFREAEARGCAVEAVRAWRRPAHEHPGHPLLTDGKHAYEEQASAALTDALREAVRDHPGVDVDRRPVEGSAHKVFLAASARADLMVVGTLRRQGHFGLQLGRVAHALLHHSECPVAVVAVVPQRA